MNKMVDNLAKLHNTLMMIETKGESTKIMAECLRFLEQMIVGEEGNLPLLIVFSRRRTISVGIGIAFLTEEID